MYQEEFGIRYSVVIWSGDEEQQLGRQGYKGNDNLLCVSSNSALFMSHVHTQIIKALKIKLSLPAVHSFNSIKFNLFLWISSVSKCYLYLIPKFDAQNRQIKRYKSSQYFLRQRKKMKITVIPKGSKVSYWDDKNI